MTGETDLGDSNDTTALKHYPSLPLEEDVLHCLVEDAVDWAQAHGMVMRTPEHKDRSDICQIAPFTLLPSLFPRQMFDLAVKIQKVTNLLYHRIAFDHDFLVMSLEAVARTDDFTRNLMKIYDAVYKDGLKQPKALLLQRADYMCDDKGKMGYGLRQVEVNNIAASMGSLTERVTILHGRVLSDLGVPMDVIKSSIVPNRPIDTIAKGLSDAWTDFNDTKAAILFIVEEENQNEIDQRHVEYRIDEFTKRRAKCIRMTLTACAKRLSLKGDNRSLFVDNTQRIGIVYFRAGYVPANYFTELEWDARRTIELSDAIKSPWIGLQLANTKKIQQVLSNPHVVEKYLPDFPEESKLMRGTFAGLWGLESDDQSTETVVRDAVANPSNYVLKPQLEGGWGNYYGEDLAEKLRTMTLDERAAYILMEKIHPMVTKNYLIRPFQNVQLSETVGELGIYGCLYGKGSFSGKFEVVFNECSGHIIRSKGKDVDKGGVAVGAAFIDSPFLF
ncbi:hypothetical protein AB6A40_005246 [Gnathostoma spinigerum]|uniref:Glutathione synthetase n=1 Tax=Gnathostoma spinigerum TaxID=75299 RepID=A0ABD6EH37_9BILA